MSEETKGEIVTPPVAAEPAVEAKAESEDSFVDEMIGEEEPVVTPEETAKQVEPETKTPEPTEEPKAEEPVKEPTPEAKPVSVQEEPKISRLDRRLAQKYRENVILKGGESPSDEAIWSELSELGLDEKKSALRNIIAENNSLRGQNEASMSNEDEEAIIEAEEVERRYIEAQWEEKNRRFQEDLVQTLANHPELDSRTASYNKHIDDAVSNIVQSGVLPSVAYKIVNDAIQNVREEERKKIELEKQKAMSGAVIAPNVQEVINQEPETDEDRFIRDALG